MKYPKIKWILDRRRKFTKEQVVDIKRKYKEGRNINSLAVEYKARWHTIERIVDKKARIKHNLERIKKQKWLWFNDKDWRKKATEWARLAKRYKRKVMNKEIRMYFRKKSKEYYRKDLEKSRKYHREWKQKTRGVDKVL